MKKRLLPIALLAVLGLVACNPTTSSSTTGGGETTTTTTTEPPVTTTTTSDDPEPANSFSISNKDELTAEWRVGQANRTIEFASDPAMNVSAEISNGNLVITSSDANVIEVIGKNLAVKAAGTATITATWRTLSDTVTISTLDKAPVMGLKAVREGIADGSIKEDSIVDFYGVVTATMEQTLDHIYSGVYVQDGDYAMMVYSGTTETGWFDDSMTIGSYVYVKGTLAPYNGLNEVKPTEFRVMTDEEKAAYTVATPTAVAITGDTYNATDLLGQDGRLFTMTDVVYKSGKITDLDEHTNILFTAKNSEGQDVEITYRANYHIGTTAMAELKEVVDGLSAGSVVDLTGVISWYNVPQLAPQFLDGKTPAQNITVHEQANPETFTIVGVPETFTVGQSVNLSITATPAGANASATWTSSNPTVATVEGGLVTALAEGTTTITATSTVVPSVTASVELTVGAFVGEPAYKLVASIDEILADEAANKTQIYILNGAQAVDVKSDQYGNMYFVNGDGKIQVYGSTATLSAFEFDQNTRTYSFDNPKDFMTNTFTSGIKNGDLLDVLVIRDEYKGTKQLNAVIRGVNGTVIPSIVDTSDTVYETAMNTYVATQISGTITGWQYEDSENGGTYGNVTIKTEGATNTVLVYGLTAQTSCLKYDADEGYIYMSNPKDFLTNPATKDLAIGDEITVVGVRCDYKDAPQIKGYLVLAAQPESVTVSGSETLYVGNTATYTAAVTPTAAAQDVVWSVDNAELAEITSEGVLTAKAAGTVVVTATAKGNDTVKGTLSVEIVAVPEGTTIINIDCTNIPEEKQEQPFGTVNLDENVTFATEKGTSKTDFRWWTSDLRCYAGNTGTFSIAEGYKIASIEFNVKGDIIQSCENATNSFDGIDLVTLTPVDGTQPINIVFAKGNIYSITVVYTVL